MRALRITNDNVDSLATDGRVVHIRDIGPGDLPELLALHDRASDRSIYLRYFSANREAARRYVAGLATPHEGQHALGAFAGDELLGLGVFDVIDETSAEFAVLVADTVQHGGIGTLLLEHLIAEARGVGVRRLVAEVLASNSLMMQVIQDLGFSPTTHITQGETHIEFALDVDDQVVTAISAREQSANAASLRPLLAPTSVVVVGAGRRSGSVGHEVLRNILEGGFTGRVFAVNPHSSSILGVDCVPTVAALPIAVDLAVIALPAKLVPDAVQACGERGVRAAVLLGSGFSEMGPDGAVLQDRVLAIAREHGIRLVGPNCVGVANTDPDVRLDATFAAIPRQPGRFAVLAQSGAFGVALLSAAEQVGLGISQFVSVGNKIDVGGNDLLLAWDQDPRCRVIGAYLESVGDPRRFARIARRVARQKPILVIKSGRTEVGRRAGVSHTAAAASSDVAIDALFRASGVLRVRTMQEMLDAARVLVDQPLPRGPRLAIVGNSGGPEILAADAASDAGLQVPEFDPATVAALTRLGFAAQNPLDLGAAVQPDEIAAALRIVTESPVVDAVLTVVTDVSITDAGQMSDAVTAVATGSGKPFVSVAVGEPPRSQPEEGTPWALPVFTFPEAAAAALGVAYRYSQIKGSPTELSIRPEGTDSVEARALVDAALREGREWLGAADSYRLLASYGVPVCPHAVVNTGDEAVKAAADLGYPVAVKLAAPGVHKTDVGGVRLNIADEAALRAAVDEMSTIGGPLLLQPMISGGTELIVGSVHDPHCGPLVMVGAGGVLTDVLGDRSFGFAPLTDAEAGELIANLRSARLLDGYRGAPVVSRAAVRDVLVRIGALVDDVPEIAELDLNPLICRPDGLHAVDARIRIAIPPRHPDPLVRQLRGPRSC